MFVKFTATSNAQTRFIMFALGISMLVHYLIAHIANSDDQYLQQAATSRLNISMYSADINIQPKADVTVKESVKVVLEKEIQDKPRQYESKPKDKQKSSQLVHKEQVLEPITTVVSAPQLHQTPNKITDIKKPMLLQAAAENLSHQEINADNPQLVSASLQDKKSVDEGTPKSKVLKQASDFSEHKSQKELPRYKIGSINNPKPKYPLLAVKRGWQGEVVLGVYVKHDGSIEHLAFVKSTHYGVLNYEAYETVRTSWHFTPLEDQDELSKVAYIEVPIIFSLANR